MFAVLLGKMLYVLGVASLAMGTLVSLVRGIQGINHFGWNSRRALGWWHAILVALMGATVISHFIQGRPLHIQMYTAAGLGIGLLVGGVLLVVRRPRWPTRSNGEHQTGLVRDRAKS